MDLDEPVCLCFRVSRRKLINFCKREKPQVASQLSECLGAGTGCGWCVPFLEMLHQQAAAGVEAPDLPFSMLEYARRRAWYRKHGKRPSATDIVEDLLGSQDLESQIEPETTIE
jgi:bacterioferritin-associated ferredoxin